MQVKDLLRILERADPEANVLIMEQPHYPFEHDIAGVTSREDFEEDCDREFDSATPAIAQSDVFIVAGAQLRYGSDGAWDSLDS